MILEMAVSIQQSVFSPEAVRELTAKPLQHGGNGGSGGMMKSILLLQSAIPRPYCCSPCLRSLSCIERS